MGAAGGRSTGPAAPASVAVQAALAEQTKAKEEAVASRLALAKELEAVRQSLTQTNAALHQMRTERVGTTDRPRLTATVRHGNAVGC